jgi:hypothetical protein
MKSSTRVTRSSADVSKRLVNGHSKTVCVYICLILSHKAQQKLPEVGARNCDWSYESLVCQKTNFIELRVSATSHEDVVTPAFKLITLAGACSRALFSPAEPLHLCSSVMLLVRLSQIGMCCFGFKATGGRNHVRHQVCTCHVRDIRESHGRGSTRVWSHGPRRPRNADLCSRSFPP